MFALLASWQLTDEDDTSHLNLTFSVVKPKKSVVLQLIDFPTIPKISQIYRTLINQIQINTFL